MSKAPVRPILYLVLVGVVVLACRSSYGGPVVKYVARGDSPSATKTAAAERATPPAQAKKEKAIPDGQAAITEAFHLPPKLSNTAKPKHAVTGSKKAGKTVAPTFRQPLAARAVRQAKGSDAGKLPSHDRSSTHDASIQVQAAAALIDTHVDAKSVSDIPPSRTTAARVTRDERPKVEQAVGSGQVKSALRERSVLAPSFFRSPANTVSQEPPLPLAARSSDAVVRPAAPPATVSQSPAPSAGSSERLVDETVQEEATGEPAPPLPVQDPAKLAGSGSESASRAKIRLVPAPIPPLRSLPPAAPQIEESQTESQVAADPAPANPAPANEEIVEGESWSNLIPQAPSRSIVMHATVKPTPAPQIDESQTESQVAADPAPANPAPANEEIVEGESWSNLIPQAPSRSIVMHATVKPTPAPEPMNSELVQRIVGQPSLIAFVTQPAADYSTAPDVEFIEGGSSAAADDEGDAVGLRPIDHVSINVRPTEGELPPDHASARFDRNGEVVQHFGASRHWMMFEVNWEAASLATRPIYFEDVNLERYGYSHGLLMEPFFSAAHFFVRVPFIPYMRGASPPRQPVYTLGYGRPGTYFPYYLHRPPFSVRGALQQAVTAVGLVYLLP